jgi:hypothetical protein
MFSFKYFCLGVARNFDSEKKNRDDDRAVVIPFPPHAGRFGLATRSYATLLSIYQSASIDAMLLSDDDDERDG